MRGHDLDALGELYRWLGGSMLTLARSMLRNRDEADDVVEDALMRIRRAAGGFRGDRGLRTWTLRIVANLCRDRLRRAKFSAGAPEDLDPIAHAGLAVDPATGWDEAIDRRRLLEALERALATLPAEQREAVVVRDRLGMTYEESAEALGISVAALKSRLFRGRARLRALLGGAFEE